MYKRQAVRSQGGENNYPILRYSDVYLMRAEALNAINTSDAEAYELSLIHILWLRKILRSKA